MVINLTAQLDKSTCAVSSHLVISITFLPPVEASRRSRHRGFAQGAEVAEKKYHFFSADPRGIGFAFHRAGRAEKK